MAKRYYVCRRIGAGTEDDKYRSELRKYIESNYPIYKHIRQIVTYTSIVALMKYDLPLAVHNDIVVNVPELLVIPEGALNNELNTVSPTKRLEIKTKLENAGFDFTWATLTNTIKDVLKYIAHTIQMSVWVDIIILAQNFDINKTVSEISVAKRQKVAQHLIDYGIDTSWITGATTMGEIVSKVITEKGRFYDDND